ncbi:MAG: hypothetical protein E4H03_13505 [Myxococcales bacterium]|nr:MAG: hypothetical protein E4H03_13505 [Myxococcales bacterium]
MFGITDNQETHSDAVATASGTSDMAAELIEEARAALASGNDAVAFDCLDRAVSNTADPELLWQIHGLASERHDKAGFVAKHTKWHSLLKAADHALALEGQKKSIPLRRGVP